MGEYQMIRRAALAALLGAALSACNSEPVDKSGATPSAHATTLRMFVPAAGDPEARYFADAVAERSGGRLRVRIDSAAYNDIDPVSEQQAAVALSHGKADLGFIAGREWAQLGNAGFGALQTPFLVTTMSTAIELTRAPVAKTLLDSLSSQQVVGLALSVQEPRQLLTTRPFFGSDLAGAHIRVVDNDLTARLIGALGGVPVQGLTAHDVAPLLSSGRLDGAETSPVSILDNAYSAQAPYLTAFSLVPKINTIVASQASWQHLSGDDRSVLNAAATATRDYAATDVPQREDIELGTLCAQGLVLDKPPAEVLSAFAARVRAQPRSAPDVVKAIENAVEGLGPQLEATVFPAQCQVASNAAVARSFVQQHTTSFVHRGGSTVPVGSYVTTDTAADFGAGNVIGPDWDKDIVFTQTFYADGRFLGTQQPDYPDQGPVRGRYVVRGDEIRFTFAPSNGALPEVVKWSYYNGELTFAAVDVPDSASRVIYLAHPWRKVS